jgi:uncharacterized MnhB-related membrane protein
MIYLLIGITLLVCAVQAVRSERLLHSALWLAGASALTALIIYMLGAPEVAVIELSVGAGLVTVLFVFAINIAGEEALPIEPVVPRPLAWMLVALAVLLLGWLNRDLLVQMIGVTPGDGFTTTLWNNRQLDVYLQIALIFSGVLSVLGLLAESHPSARKPSRLAQHLEEEHG